MSMHAEMYDLVFGQYDRRRTADRRAVERLDSPERRLETPGRAYTLSGAFGTTEVYVTQDGRIPRFEVLS